MRMIPALLLLAGCSSTQILVDEAGTIQFSHRQIGTDVVGLSWQSEPAQGGGRFVNANMHAVVRPTDQSASQYTIREGLVTLGSVLTGGAVAGPAGAGVGLVAPQIVQVIWDAYQSRKRSNG